MEMVEIQTDKLKKTFESAGIQVQVQESASGEERLVIPLTQDLYGRSRVLLLNVYRPPYSKEEKEAKDQKYNLQFLQFYVPIPIPILENKIEDMGRLLNMLNTVSELPGFFIIEKDRIPFFRYNMVCSENRVPANVLVMTVGLILFILEKYTDIIDKIASGKKILSDLEA